MVSTLQLIIQKYASREQLVSEGIWKGSLYHLNNVPTTVNVNENDNNNNDNHCDSQLDKTTRGWLWRTVVISSPIGSNKENGDNDDIVQIQSISNTLVLNHLELINVPLITTINSDNNDTTGNKDTVTITNKNKNDSMIKRPAKKFSTGIRKLTPKETFIHPLRHHKKVENNEILTDDYMTLQETLEIIELDLSRLIIDDIFQIPKVHSEMGQILFSYLVFSSNSKQTSIGLPLSKRKYCYKQGFHEILGIIFLQLYNEDDADKIYMKNTLFIYNKLMEQIAPVFYNESELINWESSIFSKLLKSCSTKLYNIFYAASSTSSQSLPNNDTKHSNMIWLIRWTRLLLLRELPRNTVYIIWDHILTFQYPVKVFIASIIVSLIIRLRDTLLKNCVDNDDLIEIMLHIKNHPHIRDLDPIELCKMAGNLSDLWLNGNFQSIRVFVDNYLHPIDPNRRKMENILRSRVQKTINR